MTFVQVSKLKSGRITRHKREGVAMITTVAQRRSTTQRGPLHPHSSLSSQQRTVTVATGAFSPRAILNCLFALVVSAVSVSTTSSSSLAAFQVSWAGKALEGSACTPSARLRSSAFGSTFRHFVPPRCASLSSSSSSPSSSSANTPSIVVGRGRCARLIAMSASSAASPPTSSWDDLRSMASSLAVGAALDAEMALRSEGKGSAFVQSRLRLFQSSSSSSSASTLPKITLYRDHAGWCPYCQKTMLLIEEKEVPVNIDLVPMRSYGDKPRSFLNLVPSGLLPALGVQREDGSMQIITESQVIMELLDQWHPVSEGYKPMLPPREDKKGWDKYDRLARLERELFSWWCTLTFRPEGPRMGGAGGGGGILGMFSGGKGAGGGNAADGKGDAAISGAMKGFLECLDMVENELSSTPGPWFYSNAASEFPSSDYPTMIDFVYASHVERMLASVAFWKGLDLRSSLTWAKRYPALNAWFDALERREYYKAFQSDYYTHVMDIPPQYGPGYDGGFDKERKEYSKIITGKDGKSWHLPLPHDDPLQPLFRGPPLPLCALKAANIHPDADGTYLTADPNAMSKACRQMAGWKLSSNGSAVSTFAARGGPNGSANPRKNFGAPLADPYAASDERIVPFVDAVLRVLCESLMEDSSDTDEEHVEGLDGERVRNCVPKERWVGVASSLAYLRDRVGVPRDMPLAAARQLRAHLNWAIDALN